MADEQYTLTGYNFKTWVFENKDDLKRSITTISGVATVLIGALNAKTPIAIAITGALTILVPIFTRWLIDGIDFWQKP